MSTAVWADLGVIGLIVLVVLAIALWAIGACNNFVRLKNLVSEGWSGIEVQLKRRSILVPNLVATVKGYAEHESSVFEEVTQARASIGRGSVGEQAAVSDVIRNPCHFSIAFVFAYNREKRATGNNNKTR